MINKILTILVIVILLYTFRWNFYDFYGMQFNQEREKIGILKIPDEWITETYGTKTKLWRDENILDVKKGRLGKEILVDNGNIFAERDRIINKETGNDESIEVTYQFNEEPKFIYKYFDHNEKNPSGGKELTKNEFDEIVNGWGIHLNLK